jgi:predicted phosphodiesterase
MSKKPKMFNIGTKPTRFIAVGCSHGKYADPTALDAVTRAKDSWKPEEVIHLGDWADTAAMRKGATGTSDESEPIRPDIDGGLQFLKDIGATIALDGNHEVRIQHLKSSKSAIVSCCAEAVDQHIDQYLAGIKCRRIPYTGIYQKWMMADITFTHGTIFNENAARDMAEMYGGKVVFAHTHRSQMAEGRTSKESSGFCVGTLTRQGSMDYANCRRATFGWRQGMVIGEVIGNDSAVWLLTRGEFDKEWRLPI